MLNLFLSRQKIDLLLVSMNKNFNFQNKMIAKFPPVLSCFHLQARTIIQGKLNSLQQELEMSTQRADEEADSATKLQTQVSRLTADLAQTRSKYERELNEKVEELEELR